MTAKITCVERFCAERGIDARQLAKRSGVDERRVQAIVEDRWSPSNEDRDSIAATFGLSRYNVAWGHKIYVEHLDGCWGPV
jgi:hypothetical protein